MPSCESDLEKILLQSNKNLRPCCDCPFRKKWICSEVCSRDVRMSSLADGTVEQVGSLAINLYVKTNGASLAEKETTSVTIAPIANSYQSPMMTFTDICQEKMRKVKM